MHEKRQWRERHPIHDKYLNLKNHAKRRKIPFNITLAEFTQWCEKTGYHEKCGQASNSLTVDRIDSAGPYSLGNIQPMSHAENSWKKSETYANGKAPPCCAKWETHPEDCQCEDCINPFG